MSHTGFGAEDGPPTPEALALREAILRSSQQGSTGGRVQALRVQERAAPSTPVPRQEPPSEAARSSPTPFRRVVQRPESTTSMSSSRVRALRLRAQAQHARAAALELEAEAEEMESQHGSHGAGSQRSTGSGALDLRFLHESGALPFDMEYPATRDPASQLAWLQRLREMRLQHEAAAQDRGSAFAPTVQQYSIGRPFAQTVLVQMSVAPTMGYDLGNGSVFQSNSVAGAEHYAMTEAGQGIMEEDVEEEAEAEARFESPESLPGVGPGLLAGLIPAGPPLIFGPASNPHPVYPRLFPSPAQSPNPCLPTTQ